jgi:hypothetical protein
MPQRGGRDPDKPPTGQADLVNALVLRKGLANMELDEAVHPFYDLMLECQRAAVGEANRRKDQDAPAEDIWNRFDLYVPPMND